MISQIPSNIDITQIANAVANNGYIIIKNAFPDNFLEQLQHRISALKSTELQLAKIGKQANSKVVTEIRSDKTCWLDNTHSVDKHYLAVMEHLRIQLNERLFLGLFTYESHYAVYEPGSFYTKHIDVLGAQSNTQNYDIAQKNQNRILSSVLYLNTQWQNQFGGELVLYDNKNNLLEIIYPENGTLVLFLSKDFPHEVKTTSKIRYSITGWFRVNTLDIYNNQ